MTADPSVLNETLVIEAGGWHLSFARVVLIATDDDVALVLVDGNGDGVELEAEYWYKDENGWSGGSSSGYGALESVRTVTWDAGNFICALGRSLSGEPVAVRYDGAVHHCHPNEFGLWGFVRKAPDEVVTDIPTILT